MVEFHEDNVETYLLTIMNMVSSLYKDPTIGNSIQVVIVKMIVLDEEEEENELNITTVASTTLDSFCQYLFHNLCSLSNVSLSSFVFSGGKRI